MGIKTILASLSLLPIIACAKGACNQDYGITYCGETTVDQVIANGITTMHGTSVIKHTEVNGTLHANGVNLNTLAVNGTANITSADVEKRSEINGRLLAKSSHFQGVIYLGSNSSKFENCATNDIYVSHSSSPLPKIYLIGTTVNGNISFSDRKGVVYICSGSKISGRVLGGEIIEGC